MSAKTFSIVIPAFNEEDAIAETLKRCLVARSALCRQAGLSKVEVIVVDDGSVDKTREIASQFKDAKLVVHPINRGYGRALMTGFETAAGDYLGFLDADGTCDPEAFAPLLKALHDGGADMAVGNRLHSGSKMPVVRELGNRFYAVVISWLSGVAVADTASGMRVFKKELLPRLSPLPSGLHFTPAMTARAACMGAKIVEAPIPYAERQGQSKLNVVADGLRFLSVILGIIFAYYPLRIFGPLGIAFVLASVGLGLWPVSYYLQNHRLEEWMIYRLLTIMTLTVCGLIALAFGLIAQKVSDISVNRPRGWLDARWLRYSSIGAGCLASLGGIALNSRTIVEYWTTRHIQTPWVYVLTGGLCVISGTVLAAFGVTLGLVAHLPRAFERSGD
ncbi:MAG: glycosyltransferase family 2 protein [Elusimicrobia bacterium]|nr:glycosyltransferase family 2 protein [Elusimicrobiota bacterium]